MNKHPLLIYFCIGLIILVTGCSIPIQGGSGGRSYFPNTDGNSWKYKYTDGRSVIGTIEGTIQIGSQTVQVMKLTNLTAAGNVTGTSETYWRVDDLGVYVSRLTTESSTPLIFPINLQIYSSLATTETGTFLIFPIDIGNLWKAYDFITEEVSFTANVTAKEKIYVPAGAFYCYKTNYILRSGTIEVLSITWFGEGAGIVKQTAISGTTTVESVLDWKNF